MTATSTAEDLVTSILADLEFDVTIPCEHTQHQTVHADEPAAWLVHVRCTECGDGSSYLLCEDGRLKMATNVVNCECGAIGMWSEWCWFALPLGGGAA